MDYANIKTRKYDLGEDILALGAKAKKAKLEDKETINATIGAMMDDVGQLYEFKSISNVFGRIDNKTYRAYPSIDGGPVFKDAIKRFVFQNQLKLVEDNFESMVCATPGASGALYLVLSNYVTDGDMVLLPHIHWSNYKEMIKSVGATYQTYQMFKENEFNLDDFKQKATMIAEITKKLVVILNDPAHNPTGYSLSKKEFKTIIQTLDDLSLKVPVILIYDVAYIDYFGKTMEESREKFAILETIKSNMITAIAFSGSKTFGLYGFRLGALIGLSRSKHLIDEMSRITTFKARATWSCSPATGISIMNHLMNHELDYKDYLNELSYVKETLNKRGTEFVKIALMSELSIYPYKDGFFVTIPVENPVEIYEDLANQHVFVIPLDKAIRVAISSICEKEIPRLVQALKNSIEKIDSYNE